MANSNPPSMLTSVPDGQPMDPPFDPGTVDTLPEGVPLSFSGELINVSDLVDSLSDQPTGEAPSEGSLPSRSRPAFDEEPTRKKHAPKPPPRELTDVSDVHELFKDWNSN